jgi:hypothetical protein
MFNQFPHLSHGMMTDYHEGQENKIFLEPGNRSFIWLFLRRTLVRFVLYWAGTLQTLHIDNSYCKRDISRMGAQRSAGIPVHAQQYRKHAGGVLLQ